MRWTPEHDSELLQMISSGKTSAECASKLGRSESSIEWRKLRHAKELIAKGRSIEDASELTKLSPMMSEEQLHQVECDSDDYLNSLVERKNVVPDDNYTNGKIYDITFEDNVVYRGSTCQSLSKRLSQHRTSSGHGILSEFIKKVGSKNINIKLVESYPCNTKEELLARERVLIRQESHNQHLLNIKHRYVETETFNTMLSSKVEVASSIAKRTPGGVLYTSEV